MNKLALKLALYTGGSLICGFVFKMLRIRMFGSNKNLCNNAFNEILFYGAEDEDYKIQVGLYNQRCIYGIILRADSSMDVCLPCLNSLTLARCLVEAHKMGKVNVRIILHNSDHDCSNMMLLAQNGLKMKLINTGVRLEHEFVLIDAGGDHALAVLGSLDHDPICPNLNHCSTILSSDNILLTALNREFERIWNHDTGMKHMKNVNIHRN